MIRNVREAAANTRRICGILLDTKGPEIRSGKLEGGKEVMLSAGQKFVVTTDRTVVGNKDIVSVDYANLPKVVSPGNHLLIDDGLIDCLVKECTETEVICEVANAGLLGETKGVNLPSVIVDLPAVTEKDKEDILFGMKHSVDFIAASFVRTAQNVRDIRALLGIRGRSIKIISKIESQEGVDNFLDILSVSDGIMVARGDMGVEIPLEKVFLAQKMMIAQCNRVGKPVITATQMLESMITNPRPTRAEATDVANAVFDGTDCVMLSGETAKGAYPIEAVTVMSRVCQQAESAIDYDVLHTHLRKTGFTLSSNAIQLSVVEAVCAAAARTSIDLQAKAIVTLTETGTTARLVSKYRPNIPILTITSNHTTARQCQVVRGLIPFLMGSMIGVEAHINNGLAKVKQLGLAKKGDIVIVVAGRKGGVPGMTNMMKVEIME